jgi:hypothetical protein
VAGTLATGARASAARCSLTTPRYTLFHERSLAIHSSRFSNRGSDCRWIIGGG